jgi:hypothetical protein
MAPNLTRHRLLEGALLRLARSPHADAFVLRGGMLMRHWFRPLPRPVGDIDLVGTFPFDVEETARRFLPVLAIPIDDGVLFDPERVRVEGIWLHTTSPGVRVFAAGEALGVEDDISVDITFGSPLLPTPRMLDLPTTLGLIARILASRPETVTGQKLQALRHMGMMHWRPKDLNDLRLLLGRVPMDDGDMIGAIAASFTYRGFTSDDARALFGPGSWWGMKMSSARWHDFVRASRGQDVPRDLTAVVASVSSRLAPILERLP